MVLELVTVPCLKDNYAFLIHDAASQATAVVDVPDAPPILAALNERGWHLTDVLLTHHHWDHVDGLPALQAAAQSRDWPLTIRGAAADAHRLPPLDCALNAGDQMPFGGEVAVVIDVPGHTVGHIAFHFPTSGLLFSGDSLMVMGCGRLFEGTAAQMWQSLRKLGMLPDETLVYSGHEYTAANMAFALTLEPPTAALILRQSAIDRARSASQPTVPSTLALERQTNPFLRASEPALKAAIGMSDAPDEVVFAEIRSRKDKF